MQNLGKDAQHVTILAVSMDPKGDTPADAQNFSRVHKLGNYFHFLLGAQDQLAPVWASYSVDAQAATSTNVVSHSSAIYVIDKDGRERVLFDSSFDPNQLSADLKTLLGE
jgi:protein SCO1